MEKSGLSGKGFTIIEILVVISIIAVLAAMVLIAINPAKKIEEARYSTAVSALNQIAKASQMYEVNNGTLPADTSRNIPTEFMTYLGAGNWPNAPWPNSVYDWDNWSDQTCWDGSTGIIQISVRDVRTYKGKTYSTQSQPISGVPQLTLYFVVQGRGIPHCSSSTSVGFCVNCDSLYTPAP